MHISANLKEERLGICWAFDFPKEFFFKFSTPGPNIWIKSDRESSHHSNKTYLKIEAKRFCKVIFFGIIQQILKISVKQKGIYHHQQVHTLAYSLITPSSFSVASATACMLAPGIFVLRVR